MEDLQIKLRPLVWKDMQYNHYKAKIGLLGVAVVAWQSGGYKVTVFGLTLKDKFSNLSVAKEAAHAFAEKAITKAVEIV